MNLINPDGKEQHLTSFAVSSPESSNGWESTRRVTNATSRFLKQRSATCMLTTIVTWPELISRAFGGQLPQSNAWPEESQLRRCWAERSMNNAQTISFAGYVILDCDLVGDKRAR